MKGFIEVTGYADGNKHLINTAHIIDCFLNTGINGGALRLSNLTSEQALGVKETYDEIKTLIEAAQKEDGVSIQYVPYVPTQEPQIVPLPYRPNPPDPYPQTTCDAVTHPVGNVSNIGTVTTSTQMDADGDTIAVELAKIVGKKNEREHMVENDCDFCEGGAIRFALKRGGHADDWFDYTRQLTVSDGAINIEVQNELSTEVENIIFEGISHCPFCGKTFQENTEDET